MFKKLNLNWSAVWRKLVAGATVAALLGYTYKAGEKVNEAIDEKYPKPKDQVKNDHETPTP
jgi:hypothetical protein